MLLRRYAVPAAVTLASTVAGFALSQQGAASSAPIAEKAAGRPANPLAVAAASAELARYPGPQLGNAAAYIPAQCYARTHDESGKTHNGCFVCHQHSRAPNYVDDADVQSELSLPSYATRNRWTNVQTPPPQTVISDAELFAYVRKSNYLGDSGGITLAQALARPPAAWDTNADGKWSGFVPDCHFSFDSNGFDRDASGKATGWRAYASLPTPGMFMPTNGSAGDAMIRLPEAYRQDAAGQENEAIYRINLAIVEAYIKRAAVSIDLTDERELGSDLDADGKLGMARRIAFLWPPRKDRPFHYVGKAAELNREQEGWPVAGLFPRGTEFLHSVRYLDVVDGQVRMAAHMKELRYMRKLRFLNYGQLDQAAEAEAREKRKSPDKLKHVLATPERGVTTGVGWIMQGFIEDARGQLRPQNVEETTACIGCHGGVGATSDASFSFARKLPTSARQGGWFHASQHDLSGVVEPKRADGEGEYAHYLAQVGGADDFLSNDEARKKFFRPDGKLDPAMKRRLARDVSLLLTPSTDRALALDRAYLSLSRAQRFEAGRDVTLGGAPQLLASLVQDGPTGIAAPVLAPWQER